jgi:hypothetical protein
LLYRNCSSTIKEPEKKWKCYCLHHLLYQFIQDWLFMHLKNRKILPLPFTLATATQYLLHFLLVLASQSHKGYKARRPFF